MSGPPNEAGGTGNAAHEKLLFAANLGASRKKINGIEFAIWRVEARRLLREYWRTGSRKHLHAFARHFSAMRVRCAESFAEQILELGGGVL
jgi:hypothetical protein